MAVGYEFALDIDSLLFFRLELFKLAYLACYLVLPGNLLFFCPLFWQEKGMKETEVLCDLFLLSWCCHRYDYGKLISG